MSLIAHQFDPADTQLALCFAAALQTVRTLEGNFAGKRFEQHQNEIKITVLLMLIR